ncbi:hypothetical protein QBC40DRAFT_284748 [Triangularia verruculosa]|uniref:Uncharacterized protein n=1 Tax=Triangularia verruculosa TaxID=2587418 RepID=A0AAN6XE38_9PEZI|nr:hypothetical protein QBC40DRAFT_284748 [Triangularia verruculosa]
MPRQQILKAALGRGAAAPPTASTTAHSAARSFTTSAPQLAEDNKPSRSQTAATRLTQLSSGARRPIDVRALGANTGPSANPFGKSAAASSSSSGAPAGGKILSIKSLRLPARYAPGGAGAGTVGPRPKTGFRATQPGSAAGGAFRRGGSAGGFSRGGRTPAAGARQAGARPARLGGKVRDKKDRKERSKEAEEGKLALSEAEKQVVDRYEKGEVVPYLPTLTEKELSGYGGGLATSAQWGKVQSVIQTMRLMGGGQAFNSDSGVTMDITAVRKRVFKEKKPIFFNSAGEREWLRKGEKFVSGKVPEKARKVVVDLAVLGKYRETGFKELGDVKGMIENYTGRTWSYRQEDQRRLMEKVISLLPAEAAKGKAARKSA